jgi:hypothetical protein
VENLGYYKIIRDGCEVRLMETSVACRILVWQPVGKWFSVSSRTRLNDNINVMEVDCKIRKWMELVQNRTIWGM